MYILPIVERELRVAARRPATYYHRLTAGLVLLLFALPGLIGSMMSRVPQRMGGELFDTLAGAACFIALLAGTGAISDCVSSEKREGTLGLLFLTDLSGWDIALGKLAAHSLGMVYALLGTLPIVAISFLLGGVTFKQLALAGIALLNAGFFSLAAGLLASTISWDARRAGSSALGIILLFVIVLPLVLFGITVYLASEGYKTNPEWVLAVLVVNPGYSFVQITSWFSPLARGTEWFWYSLLGSHLLAWGFLWLTSVILPRVWQDKPATATRVRWRERWRNWLQGDGVKRLQHRRKLLEIHPVTWLAARDRLKPHYPWIFLGIIAVLWLTGFGIWRVDWLNFQIGTGLFLVLNIGMRMWIGSEAPVCFAENMRSGAMELLLATPLTVQEILHGQWLAFRRQFWRPAIAVLLAEGLTVALVLIYDPPRDSGDAAVMVIGALAAMFMFALDMYVMPWVGMWQGLVGKDVRHAGGQTISLILFLPLAWFCLFLFLMALSGGATGGAPLVAYIFICLMVDGYYYYKARGQLEGEFRTLSMRRYSGTAEKTIMEQIGLVRS